MQFTHRQKQRVFRLGLLWVSITLLCAVAGPFGSAEGLNFPGRLAYWGLVSGVSILGSVLVFSLPLQGLLWQTVAWTVFALAIATGVFDVSGGTFNATLDQVQIGRHDGSFGVMARMSALIMSVAAVGPGSMS